MKIQTISLYPKLGLNELDKKEAQLLIVRTIKRFGLIVKPQDEDKEEFHLGFVDDDYTSGMMAIGSGFVLYFLCNPQLNVKVDILQAREYQFT